MFKTDNLPNCWSLPGMPLTVAWNGFSLEYLSKLNIQTDIEWF